jgi:hypothetical protein
LLFDELKTLTVSVCVFNVSVPAVSVSVPVQSVGLPDNERLMSALLTVVTDDVAVAATVTIAAVPELASKVAVSALVGAEAPAAPPVVADQFAVELASQVPEPPTQKRFAIFLPFNHV